MTMCLSKGLCCPFGSMVFGTIGNKESKKNTEESRRWYETDGIIGVSEIKPAKM